jgi:hypothetical protein
MSPEEILSVQDHRDAHAQQKMGVADHEVASADFVFVEE